jgi:hypothetical protein
MMGGKRYSQVNEYPNIMEVVQKEIEEISRVNGSIDPRWESKVDEFKTKADKFLEEISKEKGNRNYFIDAYSHLANHLTIAVTNNGTLPASDIRVEISLPNWILAFEKWPDKYDIPKRPEMPIPTPPTRGLTVGMGNFRNITSIYRDSIFNNINLPIVNHRKSSACYIKNGNTIYLWADKLLHKHTLAIRDDSFFLLAKPEAVPGEYEVECNYFCVEYKDWKKSNLKIIVQPVAPADRGPVGRSG